MPISFPCLTCCKKLRVDDEHVGRRARCPHCPAIIIVPTAAVAELIKRHIDKYSRTDFQMMMLDAAAEGYYDMANWLLTQNKNLIDAKCEKGRTPMHYAASTGKVEVIRLMSSLITDENKWKAVVNAQDGDGYQPIHSAAMRRQTESLKCLVELSVDVDAKDKGRDGETPLHIAVLNNDTASIDCLVEKLGADVNATNNQGATPIFQAAWESSPAAWGNNQTSWESAWQNRITGMNHLYELCKTLGKELKLEINGMTLKRFADTSNLTKVKEWLNEKETNEITKPVPKSKPSEIANSKSLGISPIVKPTVSEMLEQFSPQLNQIDEGIRLIEGAIFGDGPFTAHNMEETLGFLATSIRLGGQYSGISISEKKDDYQNVFDGFCETINSETINVLKTTLENFGPDNRISSLIERIEKCEKEIRKLRNVVRNFSD